MVKAQSAESGWTSLPLKVKGHTSTSVLFARPHAAKAGSDELPAGKTLFVASVPAAATADALQAAFETHGAVSTVALGAIEGGRSSTRTAHVAFANASGVKRALAAEKLLSMALPARAGRSAGRESRGELQESVDSLMRSFEGGEERRRQEEDEKHNQMDSDGFVLVTRKRTGRSTANDGNATMSAASHAKESVLAEKRAAKKKKTEGANIDFYQFQKHERKREQLVRLREQFEADKNRIAKMRADRKFKPF